MAELRAVENKELEKESKRKAISFTGRFVDESDIYLYDKYIQKWKKEGKSPYQMINKIVKDYMVNEEKNDSLKILKTDLFYALRKANWASLTPFSMQITRRFQNLELEIVILHQKLNMVLNALLPGVKFNKETLNNPGSELLKEPDFFEKYMRNELSKENNKWLNKMQKKVLKDKQTFEQFLGQLGENEWDDLVNDINIYDDKYFEEDAGGEN
ncbi:Mbov_0398 family ICE element protein [Mycoplasmopsis gallinarum]|uniref:Mbov_0398 family ICE element protein n=1 Tax=Mycoplasmopsis gallinarum TaxID=29557 RepID=UPI000487BEEC|nr:hypothetical protein [Mycoplasmopsis gallinarum]